MTGTNKDKGGGKLTPEDIALWKLVTKDDKRLSGQNPVAPEDAEAKKTQSKIPDILQKEAPSLLRAHDAQAFLPLQEGGSPGIDGHTLERLRKGKLPIEGKLDLHGHTRDEASAALRGFLAAAQNAGKRCILVVTGRGLEEGLARGVIRREFPHWLNLPENCSCVLAFMKARPEHGGEGAFYVLLRKGK